MPKLSFIAPCYNEEDNVELFYNTVIHRLQETDFAENYEIVFVNDGSKDKTYEKLKEIYEHDDENVKVVNFLHNFGKEAALLAGLKEATGDYIALIDTDCQQDPKYSIEMANILTVNQNVDMVAAKPKNEKDSKALAFFKSSFYKIINAVSDVPFYQGVSDFRVFRKNIKEVIENLPEHNRFSKGIFSWVCPEIECIEYEVQERNSGTTKWSFIKLFQYAMEGIFSFSHAPLLSHIITGVVELAIAFILLLTGIISSISNGFANSICFLFCALFLIGGIHSVNAGITAQYIAKIHTETTNRPHYIIENILSKSRERGNIA